MKNETIITNFLNGARSGHTPKRHIYNEVYGSTLSIEGDDLINYSTTIARRLGNTILLNTNKYSSTTSKIQSMIKRQASSSGLELIEKGEL